MTLMEQILNYFMKLFYIYKYKNYTNEINDIKFKIEDNFSISDLSNYLKNSNFQDDKTNNIYQNTLTLFSYGMNYYKLDKKNVTLNLEKHTYWVLYFNVNN